MIDLGGGLVLEDIKHVAVYKVLKSFYKTSKGFADKIELVKMKRLSYGYDPLEEEYANVGDDIQSIINDLHTLVGGELYTVEVVNVSTDWETGHVDDYDLMLSPYKVEEQA